ncbi:HAD-IC family P-type ATPase [Ramlibacter sp.]|uniref:HAD-IC family P-type ATPase n=1 Tax=Ramlibacter sp. TaxID=1917967 RepID=UPI002C1DC534|nr:HAD-IC family P-type ATPase [Ramlibacter sp.]HWI80841.1 HAD-IC family P-type ATPase [Ramlibacter sp.]
MHDKDSHGKPVEQLVSDFQTHLELGLGSADAQARLRDHGPNELQERPRPGFLALLWQQFDNYLVIILMVAALVSLALGEYVDSIAIMFIVALNAVVGVIQESKAEQALAALKKMAAPNAAVVRDGHQLVVPSRELVAGDIVLLEAGNFVPADLRLVQTVNLKIEEASLTGESVPVDKNAGVVLDRDIPLGDRTNTAFMGTLVSYGRGRGLVTATGMNTQIGLIAEMLQSFEDEDTPLQRKLAHLGQVLGTACLAICAVVFIYGLFRDTHLAAAFQNGFLAYLEAEKKDIVNLFMVAVSLAIAAVPEGLPAIVTICLALGMQRMIRHHALIRKLPAVETLGCATVVCSDKTGTLTQNEMTVVQGWTGGRRMRITGEGYAPSGQFFVDRRPFDPRSHADAARLLEGALLCNDARLEERLDNGQGTPSWRIVGDPTEAAMAVAALKAGFQREDLDAIWPRVQEIPFDSERKRMTTIHRRGGSAPAVLAFVKGAPDVVLDLCTRAVQDGQPVALTPALRETILGQNRAMAGEALRVLAVAYRELEAVPDGADPATVERELVFVGLLGMMDPARPEVVEALKVARGAGLKSIMVTGDYKDTAQAIAREIGLLTPGGLVLTGAELDAMSDQELADTADRLDVCCRVSPQHKTRIVEALKSRGHVVAMTGDGVNDAPALKRANIGVAMGITGTDVAKQTADMVLTDDNFASIVAAVEQGRIIYSNIRKFVYFLLACNVGEILIVFGAMLFGIPIPLRPVQLLWLNLVSDGAPALALGLEKGDPDIMKQPPRSPREHVINRDMAIGIGVVALVDAMAVLGAFFIALQRYPGQVEAAQTIAFVTLCCSELLRAFTARSEYHSIAAIGFASNRWMVWAVAVSLLLVLLVVYLPFLQPFFDTVPLGPDDWLLILPFCLAAPLAMELLKAYFRRSGARRREPPPEAATAAQRLAPAGAPAIRTSQGGAVMRVLIPVAASHSAQYAAQHVVRRFMNDSTLEVHLLNVQHPFSRYVTHFVSRRGLREWHREESEKALAPSRAILDKFGVPYAVHMEVGDQVDCIVAAARRLRCDEIVLGTSRKNSLTRLVENSVTNRVLERTPVPVEVIAGDEVSPWERYGIPAAIGALLALWFAVAE